VAAVCFYFQVHQPYRLRPFSIFDVGVGDEPRWFDDEKNAALLGRVAAKCYIPTNRLLLELIDRFEGRFKVAFSVTGTALDQLAQRTPHVVRSFEALAATGAVEFLCETDNHSLSALHHAVEFDEEVAAHRARITALTGRAPTVFRNTELIYNDWLAQHVEQLGFTGILADGVPRVLGGRSPGHLYAAAGAGAIKVLTKHAQLSDDIAFRFSNRGWSEWPLTAPKFASWLRALDGSEETVNLFLDYETFGEHQWASTGIFDFLRALPGEVLRHPELRFATPSELIAELPVRGVLSSPDWISWADVDRDLTAWLGNNLQTEAARAVYALREPVLAAGDPLLLQQWRRLLTSDHFYYMCLKWFADGDVHKYFSPYGSPYDAYIQYMHVLQDVRVRCGLESAAGRRTRAPRRDTPAARRVSRAKQ
jgi:alpha-amylase